MSITARPNPAPTTEARPCSQGSARENKKNRMRRTGRVRSESTKQSFGARLLSLVAPTDGARARLLLRTPPSRVCGEWRCARRPPPAARVCALGVSPVSRLVGGGLTSKHGELPHGVRVHLGEEPEATSEERRARRTRRHTLGFSSVPLRRRPSLLHASQPCLLLERPHLAPAGSRGFHEDGNLEKFPSFFELRLQDQLQDQSCEQRQKRDFVLRSRGGERSEGANGAAIPDS